jgi:putative CocE/NonD family hydrolase
MENETTPINRRRVLGNVACHALAALLVVVLSGHPTPISAAPPATVEPTGKVDWRWDVKIPLRDGTRLSAIAYLPVGQAKPRPCVFTLTPYIAQSYHDRGMYFASHGYPFLSVDVRGRGNSEGTFHPLIQEAKDGYDIVEWLAQQPYCNGKVTMWGGSYAGYDQWATAKERPPHLATIVPVAAPVAGVDFPARNNIFSPYIGQWLTFTSGKTSQLNVFADMSLWTGAYRRLVESGAAFRGFDSQVGNPSTVYQEWVSHPEVDAYWDAYNPTAVQYAALTLPILTITGMYDDDQPGALAHYSRYMQASSPEGRARHFVVIGPWNHAGTRTPEAEFGGLKFGPASLVDLPQLHLDWYRYAMEGGPRPEFLRNAVAYYVTGAEKWRYADSLAAVTGRMAAFYLDSTGDAARDLYSAGTLGRDRAGRGRADHYVYDPGELSVARVEVETNLESLRNLEVFHANPSKVVYVSAPLAADTEVSGFFQFDAYIAIDQPDTDFTVSVLEVARDGVVTPLSTDMMRARYREGLRTGVLVRTRQPLRYEFRSFTFASRLVKTGSRLVLALAAGNSILLEKNYNSGGTVADETKSDARPVNVTLFHDAKHPSALYVPLGAAEN